METPQQSHPAPANTLLLSILGAVVVLGGVAWSQLAQAQERSDALLARRAQPERAYVDPLSEILEQALQAAEGWSLDESRRVLELHGSDGTATRIYFHPVAQVHEADRDMDLDGDGNNQGTLELGNLRQRQVSTSGDVSDRALATPRLLLAPGQGCWRANETEVLTFSAAWMSTESDTARPFERRLTPGL